MQWMFLAATKQLYERVSPSLHIFHNVPVIISPLNFQELLPLTKVMFMQKAKVTEIKQI